MAHWLEVLGPLPSKQSNPEKLSALFLPSEPMITAHPVGCIALRRPDFSFFLKSAATRIERPCRCKHSCTVYTLPAAASCVRHASEVQQTNTTESQKVLETSSGMMRRFSFGGASYSGRRQHLRQSVSVFHEFAVLGTLTATRGDL